MPAPEVRLVHDGREYSGFVKATRDGGREALVVWFTSAAPELSPLQHERWLPYDRLRAIDAD